MAQYKLLDELKSLLSVSNARLYLANHFCELRAQVDMDYVSVSDEILKETWIKIINKIDDFEKECMVFLSKDSSFKYETAKINETIKSIEIQLNNKIQKLEFAKRKELLYLIKYEIFKLEKIFFQNKTLVYLRKSISINFNRLLFITDAYLNKSSIELFLKGYNILGYSFIHSFVFNDF
jgi:hypothetical protein